MNSSYTIKEITTQEVLPIRHEVMWPDQPLDFVKLENDDTAIHLGLYVHNQLVSVISLFITDNEAQFRKFATLKNA